MTCTEAEPLLPLVADGAVDPDSDPALFAHLASCSDCQRAVASHDLIALAIARKPAPPRRASILRLWPYAAAAGLALAAGAWLLPGRAESAPSRIAAAPAIAPPAAAVQPAPAAPVAARDVIAVPQGDGSTLYLVRQGEAWIAVDPANLDGPAQPAHSANGSGVQVRY
jgi:hypothetical protein